MTRTLGGRYRLSDFLANGDTGEVWHALDRGTNRTVAVKLLYPHLAADSRLVDRFLRARSQLTGLWHPSIARLLDVVVEDGILALVTDLVAGTDLTRRLAQAGRMDPATAGAVAASVAGALGAAHRVGVVHGDVKPSNVVVPQPGDGPARLTDFSVTLLVRAGRQYAGPFEPPPYRAPEVTEGAVPAPSSDVYALGAILVEMLDGEAGYPDLYQNLPGTDPPSRLRHVAGSCIRSDPATRPSAAAVYGELSSMLSLLGTPIGADPPERTTGRHERDPGRSVAVPGRAEDAPRTTHRDRSTSGDRPSGRGAHTGELARVAGPLGADGAGRGDGPGRRPAHGRAPERAGDRSGSTGPDGRRPPVWLLHGRLRVAIVLVVAMVLTLAGLTATRTFWGASGQAQTTGSTAGRAASASGAGAPTLSTGATVHTQNGGTEFVTYWFAVLSYATQTGDTTDLARSSNSGCADCQGVLKTIRAAYGNGGSLQGGGYLVRRVTTDGLFTLERPVYGAVVDRTPRTTVDSSGAAKATEAGLSFVTCSVVLEWASDRWQVLTVTTDGCVG
jgi:serine/threonine-protein kinase